MQAGWEDESNISEFDKVKSLGQGAFGKVFKVYHKTNKLFYAIKEMEKAQIKSNDMSEQIINEVKIMYSLNHDYIIKLYNHFEDDKNVYLILEFAQGVLLFYIFIYFKFLFIGTTLSKFV